MLSEPQWVILLKPKKSVLLNNIFLCSNSKLAIVAFFAMKKQLSILLFLLFTAAGSFAQQNNIWCFGDSAGIDFNTSSPTTFTSSIKGRGSCLSVADSTGSLLFYGQTLYYPLWIQGGNFKLTAVYNKNHQLMDNGDTLIGQGWYQEITTVNDPENSNRYYLFTLAVTNAGLTQGFYYSIIDMSYNGGLGKVVSKNNMLLTDFMADCVAAVKHGNGRDWWVITRKSNVLVTGVPVTDYYVYLISPTGINGPYIKTVGQPTNYNASKIIFSKNGEKMIYFHPNGLFEYYSFDRCTGDLSLTQTIFSENTYFTNFIGGAFSPDETKFYMQTLANPDTNYLLQFNLNAANIAASADTLFTQTFPKQIGGDVRLAPDGKIYVSKYYFDGFNFFFPYPDTTYNMYNTYLSVVNYPDSMGADCDFQPYSFYLGGNRTYYGLPNNPNYGLGALAGSACDTLTGIVPTPSLPTKEGELNLYFDAGWQKLFVNGHHIKGSSCLLQVFDVSGKLVYSNQNKITPPYYTHDVNCQSLSKGMYLVSLQTDKEKLQGRFVK